MRKITKITPTSNGRIWMASVNDGQCFAYETPQIAHDVAQRYCDEQNAKAAEPKPPEGFEFSEKPGVVDDNGLALAWFQNANGIKGFVCYRAETTLPVYWLVPAAPKRETREEAEKRWKDYRWNNIEHSHYGSFMRGAGFEP